jgi:amino acid adenylation domain-containing protein
MPGLGGRRDSGDAGLHQAFDAATIERLAGLYETLLQGVVADPGQRLSDLPLLTQAERQQLLVDWNDTRADYPKQQCIQQLIQTQVEETPDDTAVVYGDACLTYRDLNERANQVAHYLQKLGTGPEVFVGIYMERSLEMVVALLAVLKAGGAYLPLEPSNPKGRVAYMLEDSQAQVLLTQKHLLSGAPEHRARVVCVDADWQVITQESKENVVSQVNPQDMAYVIYTSGSTGRPKGVQIEHQSVVNFLTAMREQPGLTKHDTLLAVTTLSFDIAGLELLLPLMVGARVVLVSSEDTADGNRLLEVLDQSRATVMQATPTTWQLLLETGWARSNSLKIMCGGETMPRGLADQLLDYSNSVWNLYGPTETTIWSTVSKVARGDGPVAIGRPKQT